MDQPTYHAPGNIYSTVGKCKPIYVTRDKYTVEVIYRGYRPTYCIVYV